MTGITISMLVKNPNSSTQGEVFYYDIGDDLLLDDKKQTIVDLLSIQGVANWEKIIPDKYNDWINQRDDRFYDFVQLGNKKEKE